ncbi:unnamed protein product [Owenia fusiformis]|uniref:Angiotensin-converting enzyme n=1 Tax=Owenia fusiformis TaxID=6347 RepID=A0A8J1UHJ1_OWEFU|nr:unnamed protein product [Owenia fusiformis]
MKRTLLIIVTISMVMSTGILANVAENDDNDLLESLLEEYLQFEKHSSLENTVNDDDQSSREWLKMYDSESTDFTHRMSLLEWQYETDITPEHAQALIDINVEYSEWILKKVKEAEEYTNVKANDLQRQLKLIKTRATPKDPGVTKQMAELETKLSNIYAEGKVEHNGTLLRLEPELQDILSKSRDYDTLLWAWKGWRDISGKLMRKSYTDFVKLQNIGARENGFKDYGDFRRRGPYEMDIADMVDELFLQIKPMYLQLHAYVRRRLRENYPMAGITKTSPIPAHLFGNMWAQQWDQILDLVTPYPYVSTDEPNILKRKGFTPLKMMRTAEEFFTSIGLDRMTRSFWEKSMLTRPKGREVACHASASDFSDGEDFRIKMCAEVTKGELQTMHHEMGHIEYYMQYAHQPNVYRGGANPGFHEAVGDTIALSVMTPGHMEKIGLANEEESSSEDTDKQMINFLLSMALSKIAFLPFGLLIDKYRWDIYSGKVDETNYNAKWWEYRIKHQGVSPPIPRSENDFDPGAKNHVATNVPYIRYFFSFILQFMFHESLCDKAGYEGPLYYCDIFQSKTAGESLKNMLSMGASKPWPDALEAISGKRFVDTSSIIKYFEPLMKWLKEDNEKHGETPGWDPNEETYKSENDISKQALVREILEALKENDQY